MSNNTSSTPLLAMVDSAPEGRVPWTPYVSFVTTDGSSPYSSINFFDVPVEDYTDGCRTGSVFAVQLIKSAKAWRHPLFTAAILGAAQIINAPKSLDDGRYGAAVGFLDLIQEVLVEASHKLDLTELVKKYLGSEVEQRKQDLYELEVKNAAVITFLNDPIPATAGVQQ